MNTYIIIFDFIFFHKFTQIQFRDKTMEKMKKYKFISVLLAAFIIPSCVSWSNNYGKLRIIPKSQNEVTIQDLIDKWEDYNIYYSDKYDGHDIRKALSSLTAVQLIMISYSKIELSSDVLTHLSILSNS